ncbi:MAG: DUF2339 domain-containing protein [Gemmatimonadaceae bacterium]
MDSSREQGIEARLTKIEASISALQVAVETIVGERLAGSPGGDARPSSSSRSEGPRRRPFSYAEAPPLAPGPRFSRGDDVGSSIMSWFSARSAEWWLSRIGVGFVVLAILLLYGFAVDKGWITPPVRVLAGTVVGAVLFWAATRTKIAGDAETSELGMRELLYGGGLGVWYVTAYAAAVWYQIISIPSARLLFFILGIVATWISLQERREIFGFLAVATGFATPLLLPAPVTSLTELSLYLGAIAGIGLIIYLLRGWPSVIWITFVAFWTTLAAAIYQSGGVHPAALRSVSISLLLLVSGAAFTRAPSLRRRLLAIGSERYTPAPVTGGVRRLMEAVDGLSKLVGGGKSAPDSVMLWVLTLLSPVIAIGMFGDIWPRAPSEVWGVVLFALGAAAFQLARTMEADTEFQQVAFTAAALWTLLGVLKIVPEPERLAVAALHATLVLVYARRRIVGPHTLAKITIVIALFMVVGKELSPAFYGLLRWRWAIAELVTLAGIALVIRKLIADPAEKLQGVVLAVAAYLTSLLVIANILQPIWPPLITTTFALFGAGLLIVSRQRGGERLMRQLGGATMVIVVARLLLVDLASVEAIWRVLLFLVCGVLFLYTGYRLQPVRATEQSK